MRDETEIRQKLTEVRVQIEAYRKQAASAPTGYSESGAAYIEAMYWSAALHALQWAVGDMDELLLLRDPPPRRSAMHCVAAAVLLRWQGLVGSDRSSSRMCRFGCHI